MPTEDQNPTRPRQGVSQGVLAMMPPLKIVATTLGAALLVWGLLFAYVSSPAWASTITVTTTTDEQTTNGTCSLREAIEAANTNTAVDACVAGSATENDVIQFALPGTAPWTVNLTAELPALTSNIEMDGPGADQLTVRRDTGGDYRIFTVSGDTTVVTISGMTISNGNVVDNTEGGGILIADSGTLTVTDSTITDNFTEDGGGGIGIDPDTNGTLTVTGSTISDNRAEFDNGGGIRNAGTGTVEVTDSTISSNFSGHEGGALANDGDGTMTVTGSTMGPENFSDSEGGGIYNNVGDGTMTITGSTIRGNSTNSTGGGIENSGGTLTVTDSTISGNTSHRTNAGQFSFGGEGGGISSFTGFFDPDEKTTIINSTISGNTVTGEGAVGGGVFNGFGTTVIKNSTITKNTAPDGGGSGVASDCDDQTSTEVLSSIISENTNTDVDFVDNNSDGCIVPPDINSFVSNGYNLIGDGNATGAFNQTGDQVIGDDTPGLGPLTDNGGPTETHALLAGSPAIDKGPPSTSCPPPSTDQRGVTRPKDGDADSTHVCDIGSFELQSQPALSIEDITLTEGNSGTTNATFTVSLSEASVQTVTVNYATADGTATAGTDYQSSSGTLSFAPGQTTKTVSVQVNGETLNEPDETFFVNLSNPTNATISDAQGEGNITNDDPTPDTTAPKVISTFPRDGGEVGPAANIRATFSEHDPGEEGMMPSSITRQTFKLFRKGSTNQIAAAVTYNAATDIATLNPTNNLRREVTYKAVVTTQAKDMAGNRLDQNSSTSGLQQKVWFFEID